MAHGHCYAQYLIYYYDSCFPYSSVHCSAVSCLFSVSMRSLMLTSTVYHHHQTVFLHFLRLTSHSLVAGCLNTSHGRLVACLLPFVCPGTFSIVSATCLHVYSYIVDALVVMRPQRPDTDGLRAETCRPRDPDPFPFREYRRAPFRYPRALSATRTTCSHSR